MNVDFSAKLLIVLVCVKLLQIGGLGLEKYLYSMFLFLFYFVFPFVKIVGIDSKKKKCGFYFYVFVCDYDSLSQSRKIKQSNNTKRMFFFCRELIRTEFIKPN